VAIEMGSKTDLGKKDFGKSLKAKRFTETSLVTALKRVGPRVAQNLAKLGIVRVQDLLFHLPSRYQDRTRVVPISSLRVGMEAVVQGEVVHSKIHYGRRRSWLVRLRDASGQIDLRFFHFSASQQAALSNGLSLRCFGEVRRYQQGLEMVHPEYRQVTDLSSVEEYMTAVYPVTEGLGQATIRGLMDQCIIDSDHLRFAISDYLPQQWLAEFKFPPLAQALAYVHKPPPDADTALLEQGLHPCQQRLAFEELLAHYLSLRNLRLKQTTLKAPSLRAEDRLAKQLLQNLPFQLTGAQQRVVAQLNQDLEQDHPAQRLVQGDVGCGKTIVAAMALLRAVECGYQVVIMAPTEILAGQHWDNFEQWLQPLNVSMAWLSGKVKGKSRTLTLTHLQEGTAQVIVGTHALFQEDVQFHSLGLVIIDEQHRFGVHQRLALRNKGASGNNTYPHQIIMTATPIPRTLAMTAYADLDCSVIDELPPGRQAVETVVISNQRREQVIERVYKACAGGRQTYWVCTLIEESDVLQCQAAQDTAAQLSQECSGLRIGLIHGRMSEQDKTQVMAGFKQGEIDLLVATTVIEVGVDVPNATLMVIENAERLGLSQLHQLRGRVGRGQQHSVCVLMYQAPLSNNARKRLSTMRDCNDGFEIAQVDLKLRGPGEVLGTRQTGIMQYRIVDLQRDQALLPQVSQLAAEIYRQRPEIVEKLIKRWLGEQLQYGNV